MISSRGFNPRLPGGRRPCLPTCSVRVCGVSIHAFRGEGDRRDCRISTQHCNVSIHAFRGEGDHMVPATAPPRFTVSIHAFQGEGDRPRSAFCCCTYRFNPRLPGGRRPKNRFHAFARCAFQSTPSGGKATLGWCMVRLPQTDVSIHAFRGEGDAYSTRPTPSSRRFNPRLPGGRRQRRLPSLL